MTGSAGIDAHHDTDRLEAAVGAATATFEGRYLHGDAFALAAAYAVYLIKGHPFVDGNKRTGMTAALVFLKINDFPVTLSVEDAFEAGMAIAQGKMDAAGLAALLRP